MTNKKNAKTIEQAFSVAEALIEQQRRYSYPFRNRFRHTNRVLNWAKRIHEIDGGDIDIITLAVIFHDTGWDEKRDHALIGAEHARSFLLSQGIEEIIVSRVESAITTHNKRQSQQSDLPLENLVVMDADILDELGVTTLVWDAMATALEENPSFKKALEKSQQFFAHAKAKTHLLKTKTGLQFYKERIEVWAQCLEHFRYELGESDVIKT